MSDGPLLCGLNEPVLTTVPLAENPCSGLESIAFNIAEIKYNLYLDSIKNAFDNLYYSRCMSSGKLESFTVKATVSEYHYTLYYYDQAGNLVKTVPPAGVNNENFTYNYDAVKKNRLLNIHNSVNSTTSNYEYDDIGNITKDELEGNKDMVWSIYGKLLMAKKISTGVKITYSYDASGNRINKQVGNSYEEWTVRDASGNIMATYIKDPNVNNGRLTTQGYEMYGSNGIGTWEKHRDVETEGANNNERVLIRGEQKIRFSNHLGNTMLVLSDIKRQIQSPEDPSQIIGYTPEVINATDYSAYGENLIGREFSSEGIKFGFNGKLNDNDLGYQDYGMRLSSVKKRGFLSVDPLTKEYPELTPYQFASNRPIDGIDLDGLEYKSAADWAERNLANYTIHWDDLSTVPFTFNILRKSDWKNIINNVLFCAQATSLAYAQGNPKVAEYLKANHFESNRIGRNSGQFVAFTKYKTIYQFLIKPLEYKNADRGDLLFLQDPSSREQNSGHVAILASPPRDKGGNRFTVNVYTTNASYSENDESKHNNFGEAIYFFEKNDQGKIELRGKWQKNMETGDWRFKDMKSEHLELQGFGRVDEEKIQNKTKGNAKKK